MTNATPTTTRVTVTSSTLRRRAETSWLPVRDPIQGATVSLSASSNPAKGGAEAASKRPGVLAIAPLSCTAATTAKSTRENPADQQAAIQSQDPERWAIAAEVGGAAEVRAEVDMAAKRYDS
jgi:hypothetical protein